MDSVILFIAHRTMQENSQEAMYDFFADYSAVHFMCCFHFPQLRAHYDRWFRTKNVTVVGVGK